MAKPVKSHTAADKERFRKLGEMGCLPCRKTYNAFVQGEVCHVTQAGRRLSHQDTFPACPWHHRAVTPPGMSTALCEQTYGPSFARDKKAFEATYGDEESLVKETNVWLGISA